MNKETRILIDAARWPELERDAKNPAAWFTAVAFVAAMFGALRFAAFLVVGM